MPRLEKLATSRRFMKIRISDGWAYIRVCQPQKAGDWFVCRPGEVAWPDWYGEVFWYLGGLTDASGIFFSLPFNCLQVVKIRKWLMGSGAGIQALRLPIVATVLGALCSLIRMIVRLGIRICLRLKRGISILQSLGKGI